MADLQLQWNGGLVTARKPRELAGNECQRLAGVCFHTGDPKSIHRLPGRSTFGDTATFERIKGIKLLQFDNGTDRLIAYAGETLYSGTPGLTGAFEAYYTFDSAEGLNLAAAHYNDTWYVSDGIMRARRITAGVSDPIYPAALTAPVTSPLVTASSVSVSAARPTAHGVTDWLRPELLFDEARYPAAVLVLSTPGTSESVVWSGYPSGSAANRFLTIVYRIGGAQVPADGPGGTGSSPDDLGSGGTQDAGYEATITIEYSVDSGVTYRPAVALTTTKYMASFESVQVSIDNAVNSNLVYVRATGAYIGGSAQATFMVGDIPIRSASAVAAFTPETGYIYYYTQYNQTRDIESPPSPPSVLVTGPSPPTLAAFNLVAIDMQDETVQSGVTHFIVYRTGPGGTFQTAGRVLKVNITPIVTGGGVIDPAAIGADDFSLFGPEDQPTPLIAMKRYTGPNGGVILVPRNQPPPAFSHMNVWQGRIIGLRDDRPRAIHASEPGFPEYFPETNVIDDFPLPEHDQLVTTAVCGDPLIVLGQDVVIELTAWPDEVNGRYSGASAPVLSGHPGCVGRLAACSFSTAGEPRVAWVSPFGVYETNASTARRLTDDIEWDALVSRAFLGKSVLSWDAENQRLIFAYDSSGQGSNDRYLLLHMAPKHRKESGLPLITGPHRGQLSCLTAGMVGGRYRTYSGHSSDGKVYLENNELVATDASESVAPSDTSIPLDILGARIYGPGKMFSLIRGSLAHSDFGVGEVIAVTLGFSRDQNGEAAATLPKSVSLAGDRGTDFYIGRAVEWVEVGLAYSGSVAGSLSDMRIIAPMMGRAGRVA